MRNSKPLRLLSYVLMALLMIPAIPFLPISADSLPTFIEGELLYAPTLTGSGNGVPEGWIAAPETQVPWPNGGASNGWLSFSASNTQNKPINPACFTYTEKGLAVNIGDGDFSVLFPALVDQSGAPVVDYVYTLTVSGLNSSASGSFGPITDCQGGATYLGGTYLMAYSAGDGKYRHYHFTERSRQNDVTVPSRDPDSMVFQNGRVTISVYHTNGLNYYFANGRYLYTKEGSDAYSGAPLNGIGMNFCGARGIVIESITVHKLYTKGVSSSLAVRGASIRYCDSDGSVTGTGADGLRFTASVDKTSALYKELVPDGTYDPSSETVKFGMLILPADLLPANAALTVNTPNVSDTEITRLTEQTDTALTFTVSLLGIPKKQQSRAFTARVYVKEKTAEGWEYTYASETLTRSYVSVANLFYEDVQEPLIRERLDTIFGECPDYEGANAKTLTFSLFSDFHYKAGMYMSSIEDMQAILDRAHAANVDFIIHAGDFCNDYKGSPELMRAYLENTYELPALGVLGNHELETSGNSLESVAPLLTNQTVTWGNRGERSEEGTIGYYYYEINGFRIICLDTNYSFNAKSGFWEHNLPASYGAPSANTKANSLGPAQLYWLEATLMDAAEKDIPCIVVSHASLSGLWSSSPDADAAREIFNRANEARMGTVLMAINGHLHTNRAEILDGILYLDMNTTRNGVWRSDGQHHYVGPKYTFTYATYDDEGNLIRTEKKELSTLSQAAQTWFFEDPLSAIVTVSTSGRITVEGQETDWIYGVTPEALGGGQMPSVLSDVFDLPLY